MSGSYPEYGAIFMSNRSTMKECFEKRLFGLPYFLSDFVRGVKEGMILFLFEYEERKLYGVFEAISDGSTNIVPEAYTASGKRFPAQVQFTTIWQCEPLSENEFCDAIQDNYFATNRFKFGLSKDQIQNLLCLFNSRKLKIPNSLIFNKRTDGDKDLSPAVEWHRSLSSGDLGDTSRKSEDIHCEDDPYDPEHRGFHCSAALVVHQDSAAGLEPGWASNNFVGQELVTLQEEKEKFHISAENVEDFIPLPSPDLSDPEEGEVAFNEFYGENQIEWGEFVGYAESFFSVPKLPLEPFLGGKGFSQTKMEHPFASSHGSSCYKTDESSVTSLPLLDASDDYQSKDISNDSKKMLSKGMYSDCPRKASVFSRLNFALKDMEQGDQKAKPQKHETENCNVKKRTSVFMRLTGASEATAQEVRCMTRLQQESGRRKKRKMDNAFVSERDYHDKVCKPVNHFQKMLASECDTQEDGLKDDISIPEIMKNLLQRHGKWRNYGGETNSLEQRNVYRREDKKSGISHA